MPGGSTNCSATPCSEAGRRARRRGPGRAGREAAQAGTRVSIELVPSSAIQDLETARRIVDHAGEPNGGLLIDIWHMARGGISYDEVANLPPYLVTAVEVDDAFPCGDALVAADVGAAVRSAEDDAVPG